MSDNNFWLERWKTGEIGFHLPEVNPTLINHGSRLTRTSEASVFVPLCGKTLDMLWLRNQGLNVHGVELSKDAVRFFFEENQLTPQISKEGDYTIWQEQNLSIINGDLFTLANNSIPARYIYDRASLIALSPKIQAPYLQQLLNIAPDVEGILLSCMEYDTAIMSGPPHCTTEADVRKLYAPFFSIETLERTTNKPSEQFAAKGLKEVTSSVFWLERL